VSKAKDKRLREALISALNGNKIDGKLAGQILEEWDALKSLEGFVREHIAAINEWTDVTIGGLNRQLREEIERLKSDGPR
jgi:acyl transferase domain-containing protein